MIVKIGSLELLKFFFDIFFEDIDINIKGGFGMNTAMHLAAQRANFDILFELDKRGCNIFLRNIHNRTCF